MQEANNSRVILFFKVTEERRSTQVRYKIVLEALEIIKRATVVRFGLRHIGDYFLARSTAIVRLFSTYFVLYFKVDSVKIVRDHLFIKIRERISAIFPTIAVHFL